MTKFSHGELFPVGFAHALLALFVLLPHRVQSRHPPGLITAL